jgi:hypothetical protein
LLLDHDGYLPVFMDFTDCQVPEINSARRMDLPRDSIVTCDRGYIDWLMLYKWNQSGVFFVSRLKKNLKIKTFVGTSEIAVKIQAWTALISLLLVKYLKFLSQSEVFFESN